MLTKRFASGAFPACLRLGAVFLLLLILGQVVHGQQPRSPCPSIFSYRRDPGSDQVFGYIELPNLRIGQAVKLNVDLSIGLAVPQNNIGSITLVKSKEQTFRDIYSNQPAQYRVNFPFRNVLPNLLEIRVDGKPICYGQKATGQTVTTINLDHTLVTQLQTLSNGNGNNVYAIPNQPVQQSPSSSFYTPTVQIRPQPIDQSQFVIEPAVFQNRGPQPQSNDVCGEPTNIYSQLSINGLLSARGQFPWAVPIFDKRNSLKPKYICGSSILNKYHLVTAAHCMYDDGRKFRPSELVTMPGMYNIDNFFESDIQERDVASIIVHPEFYTDYFGTTEYDIALMVLQREIDYNELVRPICLWNGNDNLEDLVGRTGIVSGWGITEYGKAQEPSYVRAKVLSKNECRRELGSIFSAEKGMFCADGQGEVPCSGDSGSGLVFKQGSRFYIRGIVSIGQYDQFTLLCDTNKYVVYTDIAHFKDWLIGKMYNAVNK